MSENRCVDCGTRSTRVVDGMPGLEARAAWDRGEVLPRAAARWTYLYRTRGSRTADYPARAVAALRLTGLEGHE